jgi:Cu-Zn family superoxide dismutase
MRRGIGWGIGVFVGASAALLAAGVLGAFGSAKDAAKVTASSAFANISGPGGIKGKVTFRQTGTGPLSPVEITATVQNLPPGKHGMHIHEVGSCVGPSFASAGGHFDPGPNGNSSPDGNHPFHAGDLPNLDAKGSIGLAILVYLSGNRFTLDNGPSGLFDADGSAVIIHASPDQFTTGVPGGAGGGRIACGVIQPG